MLTSRCPLAPSAALISADADPADRLAASDGLPAELPDLALQPGTPGDHGLITGPVQLGAAIR